MKIVIAVLYGLMMCACASAQNRTVTVEKGSRSVFISPDTRTADNFFISSGKFSEPLMICSNSGDWGKAEFKLQGCVIGKGHTLDEVVTVLLQQMQSDQKRHQQELDNIDAKITTLMRALNTKTINKKGTK